MLDMSKVGMIPVLKRSALEASRRELSEDVPFGPGTLLVVDQSIELEKSPQGYVIYAAAHGNADPVTAGYTGSR